ncbi:MAG: DnaJ domain-containing protein [Bacteroidota bacterium]
MSLYAKYLEELGLSTKATKGQIKKRFRILAKKHHPDLSNDPNAEEQFIEINEAYEYLMEHYSQPRASVQINDDWEYKREAVREEAQKASRSGYKTWSKNHSSTSGLANVLLHLLSLGFGFFFSAICSIITYVYIISSLEPARGKHVLLTFAFFFIWIAFGFFTSYKISSTKWFKSLLH